MLKSVETEGGKGEYVKGKDSGKTGSDSSPSVQYVFINKSSWRTREASLTNWHELISWLLLTIGNGNVLTNPRGLSNSEQKSAVKSLHHHPHH